MTCEEFIKNNRGINGPKDAPTDLPKDFLVELYNHFSECAIRFPQLPASMSEKYSSAADDTVMKCASQCLGFTLYILSSKPFSLPFLPPQVGAYPRT